MKKLLSGSYYIVLLLGVLFVVGSFLFAKNETHFRKGEIAGHQQITPQSITLSGIFWRSSRVVGRSL